MIAIEDVGKEQLPVVQKMAYRIWPTAFKGILTDDQIDFMLTWMYSPSSLREQWDKGHRFILARRDSRAVGYAAYEIPSSGDGAKLHKLYILPSVQGAGMGKTLMNEVISRAQQSGKSILWLNVNRYNKAVGFYQKLGFNIIKEEDNAIGNGFFMNDYVMAKQL